MDSDPDMEACRICGNFYVTGNEMHFLHLFEKGEVMENELEFIKVEIEAWQVNINYNDGLPQRICVVCLKKFCKIYEFRRKTLEAQLKLTQTFGEYDCIEEVVAATNIHEENELDIDMDDMITDNPSEIEIMEATAENIDDAGLSLNTAMDSLQYDGGVFLEKEEFNEGIDVKENGNILDVDDDGNIKFDEDNLEVTNTQEDLEEVLHGNYIPRRSEESESIKNTDFHNNDNNSSSLNEDHDLMMLPSTNNNPLACQYCYTKDQDPPTFLTVEALSQHFFDVHDPTFPYTCTDCPQKFNSSRGRARHVAQRHTLRTRNCKFCRKSLRDVTQKEHLDNCKYISDWECETCSATFKQTTYSTLRSHIQEKHMVTRKQYKCSACGRLFNQRQEWKEHEILHIGNNMLWCNKCKEAFANEYELKTHKYRMHDGDLPVNCDYCNKAFVSYAFLNRHMHHFHPAKVNASTIDEDIQCTNCGMTFASVLKLKNHQQRPRDENGKCVLPIKRGGGYLQRCHQCVHCSKRFTSKRSLEEHTATHQLLRFSNNCSKCTFKSGTKWELQQHYNECHALDKAFVCKLCGRKYSYKKNLQYHMTCHEAIDIPCPEAACDFTCLNDKDLNDHIAEMHGLAPCEYCKETFAPQRLIHHLKSVHPEEINTNVRQTVMRGRTRSSKKVIVELVSDRPINRVTTEEIKSLNQSHHTSNGDGENGGQLPNASSSFGEILETDHEIIVT